MGKANERERKEYEEFPCERGAVDPGEEDVNYKKNNIMSSGLQTPLYSINFYIYAASLCVLPREQLTGVTNRGKKGPLIA